MCNIWIHSILSVVLCAAFLISGVKSCESQFQCQDGTLIDFNLKCNGAVDCPDRSDEDFVLCRTNVCKDDEFQCVYGGCVKRTVTCDGVMNCADNSDELIVECRNETTLLGCLQIAQQNVEALPREKRMSDTLIMSDEFYSSIIKPIEECELKHRTCNNGQRIEREQRCDGVVHCTDGSDETLETCASKRCHVSQFRCKNGACVMDSAVCDGVPNCSDGSDELENLCNNNESMCSLPSFPANGYYSAGGLPYARIGQKFESVHLNYSCDYGYKLVGVSSSYCIKGWWSDKAPKCVPQCILQKNPSVEYICQSTNVSNEYHARECDELVDSGTVVHTKCHDAYYYSGVLSNMHCTHGAWNYVAVCSPECGLITSKGDQMMVGGRSAKHGEIPWHSGIYLKTTQPYKQICGGSLISSTVVVSAAHCFWSELGFKLPASDFAVALGKLYRSWNNIQDEAQKADVREIMITPRFRGAASNFQEDIALVVVTSPFKFSTYVRPVCIDFDYNFNRQQLRVGAVGKVAGWGLTEEDGSLARELQVVEIPYVDITQCIAASPPEFYPFITSDKFCAGVIDGSGRAMCKGDSGGGLAFKALERGTERYFLRGVVSTAPANDHLCNTNVYTTFTELKKHEEFIMDNFLQD